METLRLQGARVSQEEPLPKWISERVEPFLDAFATIGRPNRVFYSVIAKAKVQNFLYSEGFNVHGRGGSRVLRADGRSKPMSGKMSEKKAVTGSTRGDLTREIKTRNV